MYVHTMSIVNNLHLELFPYPTLDINLCLNTSTSASTALSVFIREFISLCLYL